MIGEPHPTLVEFFDRWPEFLKAFSSGREDGHGGFYEEQWTKSQIEGCLVWGLGEDWKDLRVDLVPMRLMERLGVAIPAEQDPFQTFKALAEKYWYTVWALRTQEAH